MSDKIASHKDMLAQRRGDEERRLLYVALTRSEDTLLLSGHHWGATEAKPRGPSEFLLELKDIIDASAAAGAALRRHRRMGAATRPTESRTRCAATVVEAVVAGRAERRPASR